MVEIDVSQEVQTSKYKSDWFLPKMSVENWFLLKTIKNTENNWSLWKVCYASEMGVNNLV